MSLKEKVEKQRGLPKRPTRGCWWRILHAEIDNAIVKVLSSEVGISSCRFDLKDSVLDGQKRDIESASTHIVNEDIPLATGFLVQTVGNGCGGGLIDDAENVQTRDGACILGCLALRVVEVGRDGHDGVVDLGAKVSLRCLTGRMIWKGTSKSDEEQ